MRFASLLLIRLTKIRQRHSATTTDSIVSQTAAPILKASLYSAS
ncbi:hypothetical protein AVDCRST_MAG94-7186 [uncultured Leptolyngbya sp.]|uniref:Uncharacterized protein n=1 Tax=uncultured Leptolyngbya sp. TaxID=332963 RepID=A0A6J4PZV4_9CYAN|nr:hypothetical protein AVDCRST_MAG94-7186 [uncultured Leptolyngbya sp.]